MCLDGLLIESCAVARKEDMELLERQLAQSGLLGKEGQSPIPRHTISDETTLREDTIGNLDEIIHDE